MKEHKKIKRSKNFELYYDDCETELLRILADYEMTFADLSRATGIHSGVISGFAYGTVPPIFAVSGLIKPKVVVICDYFLVDPSEVFPRYFCSIDSKKFKFDNIPYETFNEYINDENFIYNRIEAREILEIMKYYLSAQRYEVFKSIVCDELTLSEIGRKYNVGGTRIGQIHASALREIRHYMRIANGLRISPHSVRKKIIEERSEENNRNSLRKILKYIDKRKNPMDRIKKDFDRVLTNFDKRIDKLIIIEERLTKQAEAKAEAERQEAERQEVKRQKAIRQEAKRQEAYSKAEAKRHMRTALKAMDNAEAEAERQKAESNKGFFKKVFTFFNKT